MSPLLPNTICWTLTAVPQSSGMWLMRRYSTARGADPRVEHGADRLPELLLRVLREVLAGLVAVELLERVDVSALRSSTDSSVSSLDARLLLLRLDRVLDLLAGDAAADVAEHLHEAAVGVPGEALVAGLPREALDRLVVQAQVEDRVHHAGHRLARARADRHEQRVVGVAELLAGVLLEPLERLGDLVLEAVGLGAVGLHVGDARLGRDREARGHALGAEDARHLGDVRALAAEQLAHVARALGEVVDVLRLAGYSAGHEATAALVPTPRAAAGRGRGARGSPRWRDRPAGARARARRAPPPAGGRAPRPGTGGPRRPSRTSPPRSRGRRRRRRWPRRRRGARGRRTWRRPPARARSPPPAAASAGTRARARAWPRRRRRRAAAARGRAGCRRAGSAPAESSRRRTASQAWLARSSESRRSRSAGCAATVSACVTVQSSPRPSCSTRLTRKSGSSRPPKRDLTRRTPFRDRADPSALGGIQVEDAVGLSVADGTQDDGLGLERPGMPTL